MADLTDADSLADADICECDHQIDDEPGTCRRCGHPIACDMCERRAVARSFYMLCAAHAQETASWAT